ncbi:mechanosensitive ion channel family protein [Thermodesulfobacteriota bacterium]
MLLFLFGRIGLRHFVLRLSRLVDDGDDAVKSKKEKRAETLGHIIIASGNVVIYTILLITLLSIFGVDIRPILASAGVIGLAVGFGAQTLVKDFVSGLFILIENQYGIGDRVKIGSAEGEVIKISMRSTVIKDDDGNNHYISNGSIKGVINSSQK